jgi:D-sedoheptulose 7-phosphate isomerase
MDNEKFILLTLEENIEVLEKTKSTLSKDIMGLINEFEETFERGNKVFVFGNGGCAGVAQQMASAFIGRSKSGKPSRPVISLSSDASLITALCNDYGFENIYKKQVEAYVKEGDLVIGLTASGNSLNVLKDTQR